jgi:hypothetical protein
VNLPRKLSQLFEEVPARWNLRGDPYLWREMKDTVDNYKYADTEEEFRALVEQIFEQLTGASLKNREPIFVERYSHGGISSGYVSPEFWRKQILPLLLERYRG